jgi:hypothetical protein
MAAIIREGGDKFQITDVIRCKFRSDHPCFAEYPGGEKG